MDWSKLKFNNYYWLAVGEYDVYIKGESSEPANKYLGMAKYVIAEIEEVSQKAIEFLETFLKLEGEWEIHTLDFGCCHSKVNHDFELTFSFEDRIDKHKYVYTYYVVSFDIQKFGDRSLFKPQRLEVGFC
ncbi:hypothetical protein [Paenibacillus xylanilyticus]|uniref:hypothetical protein n=1 Tax=Paenibacillus xylanilyticus TaxID=248903 RepID=UPI00399F3309